jgi:hypothetical protein
MELQAVVVPREAVPLEVHQEPEAPLEALLAVPLEVLPVARPEDLQEVPHLVPPGQVPRPLHPLQVCRAVLLVEVALLAVVLLLEVLLEVVPEALHLVAHLPVVPVVLVALLPERLLLPKLNQTKALHLLALLVPRNLAV